MGVSESTTQSIVIPFKKEAVIAITFIFILILRQKRYNRKILGVLRNEEKVSYRSYGHNVCKDEGDEQSCEGPLLGLFTHI